MLEGVGETPHFSASSLFECSTILSI